jgi:hypothetical protein
MAPRPEGQTSAPRIPLVEDIGSADAVDSGRSNPRQTAPRDLPRVLPREDNGAVVVEYNGELLSRRRTATGDIFDIPLALVPKGIEYQWCAVSIAGNSEVLIDQTLMFQENGWRPVPAERHPGRFMPAGHKGSIIRGGQMLMERPTVLSDEARAEEYRKAYDQVRDRDEGLMGRKANLARSMGDGLELRRNTEYKGRRTQMSIDNAYDIPAPAHKPADDSAP